MSEIPPDFILRAHDALAPETIARWIQIAERAGVNTAKLDAAEKHLQRILDWQDTHPDAVKLPD